MSKTTEWALPAADTPEKMLGFDMPGSVRRKLRRKLGGTLHDLSSYYLKEGDSATSWRYHLGSLLQPEGFSRYGAFTRKLIAASFRK